MSTGQKRVSDPPAAELQAVVSCLVRVQRIELGFSVSAACTFNFWIISPTPDFYFSLHFCVVCHTLLPETLLEFSAGHTCWTDLFSPWTVSGQSFDIKRIAVGFLQNPFTMTRKLPSIYSLPRALTRNGCWSFVEYFLCGYWDIKFLMVNGIDYLYVFPLLFLPLPSISCMRVLRGRALSVTSISSPPVPSTQWALSLS